MDALSGLRLYLDQLDNCIKARLSIPCLFLSLPIPEILGHIDYNGNNRKVYYEWWENNIPLHLKGRISGYELLKIRNSFFHHFGANNISESSINVAFSFSELSPVELHFVDIKVGGADFIVISPQILARDIHSAASAWLESRPKLDDQDHLTQRMLRVNYAAMEPLAKGVPLVTFRTHPEGQCTEWSVRR
jgi:hypothetical protein